MGVNPESNDDKISFIALYFFNFSIVFPPNPVQSGPYTS